MATLCAVDDLVAALRELRGRLSPALVSTLLHEVRIDQRTLRPYLRWVKQRYTRNLIARDDAFEMIAMCWDAGAFSPIHDHASSDCAFVLVRGAVDCEDFRLASPPDRSSGRARLLSSGTRTMRPGDIDLASGSQSVHRVGAVATQAITLHVYAKPLDECLNYDSNGIARVAPARYDNVSIGG